ncbi:MAG: hypothetical protein E7052_03990 [Lentisphaerae bacterium]|nr:hypothetical protein [Lentisphaerota bacterium]
MKTTGLLTLAAAMFALPLAAEVDLSAYQAVDPQANIASNGTFETFWAGRNHLPYWGKTSPNVLQDKTIKHSGNASLKIGNVEKGYASAAFKLGKIADLKDDLLIRGYCKYENISNDPKASPFIGIWTYTDKNRNSRTFPMVKVPAGSGDWFYFEKVLKVDALKAAAQAAAPQAVTCALRINMYLQPGWIWLDDIEIIPLKKK